MQERQRRERADIGRRAKVLQRRIEGARHQHAGIRARGLVRVDARHVNVAEHERTVAAGIGRSLREGFDQHAHVVTVADATGRTRHAEHECGVLRHGRRGEDDAVLIAGIERDLRPGGLSPGQRLSRRRGRPCAHRRLAPHAHGLIAARDHIDRSGRSGDADRSHSGPLRAGRIDERDAETVGAGSGRIEADRLRPRRHKRHRRTAGLLPGHVLQRPAAAGDHGARGPTHRHRCVSDNAERVPGDGAGRRRPCGHRWRRWWCRNRRGRRRGRAATATAAGKQGAREQGSRKGSACGKRHGRRKLEDGAKIAAGPTGSMPRMA